MTQWLLTQQRGKETFKHNKNENGKEKKGKVSKLPAFF